MSENENITSPGVPESESGSASLSEESAAVPCSSADDATLSDAPLAEGGGAEEEGAGAPEEEAEKGPETYIVTADGVPVGGTAYRRGNAILNFIKSVLGLGQKGDMVPGGEKISYYTYFAGQNLIYALVSDDICGHAGHGPGKGRRRHAGGEDMGRRQRRILRHTL